MFVMEIILWCVICACALKGLLIGLGALNMKVSPFEHVISFCVALGFANSLAITALSGTPKVVAHILAFIILYIVAFIAYLILYLAFEGIFFVINLFHGGTLFSRILGCVFNALLGVAAAWAIAVFVSVVDPDFVGGTLYNAFVGANPVLTIWG